ncbi:hypothetical protein GQE99_12200 [Maritimibacter sp. DP07]|uniref:Uncharacterized protein n=1 Tax=Maritimibacter harenae TaxID=2606218 RepID=A0A845M155_9RHOB|nr:hypothetical protein [Maritimibacter harenae]MZR13775.1 hypothetical protein [Maritimibacter harenae]
MESDVPQSRLKVTGFDARRIVTILAVFAFIFGTLLDVPAVHPASHDAPHASQELHATPLQSVIVAIADNHCQQNAGCHAAVLPAGVSLSSASSTGSALPQDYVVAVTERPIDVFHPPRRV